MNSLIVVGVSPALGWPMENARTCVHAPVEILRKSRQANKKIIIIISILGL